MYNFHIKHSFTSVVRMLKALIWNCIYIYKIPRKLSRLRLVVKAACEYHSSVKKYSYVNFRNAMYKYGILVIDFNWLNFYHSEILDYFVTGFSGNLLHFLILG